MIEFPSSTESLSRINDLSYQFLRQLHLPEQTAALLNLLLLGTCFLMLAWAMDKILNWLFTRTLRRVSKKSFGTFAAILIQNRVMRLLAHFIPLMLITKAVPVIFARFPDLIKPFQTITDILLVILFVNILRRFFRSLTDLVKDKPAFRDKPMDSYLQVVQIVLLFVAGILIFSLVTGKSVWAFFTAMGALSAILLLVFKDSIMGFVASIQVTSNDMVRIGDWIEMPKYGADGDVTAITLTTVKVQNWDKTITTIPTYALISDSFKNWRGMQHSGGRRMKRAIFVKINSVRFLSEEDISRFRKISLIKEYLDTRSEEINTHNRETGADKSVLINGRNMTNIGVFRQYIVEYLSSNPNVHTGMTRMVRQLAPSESGMPIEIYAFTKTVKWVEYESIMADIFDHIMVAASYFDLEIHEHPAGSDFQKLIA